MRETLGSREVVGRTVMMPPLIGSQVPLRRRNLMLHLISSQALVAMTRRSRQRTLSVGQSNSPMMTKSSKLRLRDNLGVKTLRRATEAEAGIGAGVGVVVVAVVEVKEERVLTLQSSKTTSRLRS